jgi:ATP-dependent Clp protease, protease subunit
MQCKELVIVDLPEEIYLTFAGTVEQQATSRFFNSLNIATRQGVGKVHLLIQSTGGIVEDGIAIYNYLTNLPLELITYNEGAVQSIGLLLYLAGKLRKCARDASFLIHKTTFTFQVPVTAEMMRARAEAAEDCDKKTDAILRNHIRMPDDRWALRDRFDLTINAEEAKQFGLVHEITHFAPPQGSQVFNL